jgi:hypothetical protein
VALHQALAEDGPLAGDRTLKVEEPRGTGWPSQVVWCTNPDSHERHVYRFKDVALRPSGVPVYEFVRTLDPEEPIPERYGTRSIRLA